MYEKTLENLTKAILNYDGKDAARWAKEAVQQNIDPIKAIDAMTAAIKQIGDGFGSGELYLPDLVGGADAMAAAVPIIEQEMKRRGVNAQSSGTVVIGTVYGDIHTIGKTLVATLLSAEGFTVHDLGINVSAANFEDAVKEYKPDIVAMSALLTTTAAEQRKVIELLVKDGLRGDVKIMVGGAPITQQFANEIGADGYASTAPEATKLARQLTQEIRSITDGPKGIHAIL
jgi:corrinoid protein of di/trimethylamine methyltransferase